MQHRFLLIRTLLLGLLIPFFRLRPARPRVDIQEGVAVVQFTAEHALELERTDAQLEFVQVCADLADRRLVVLFDRELQEFTRIAQACIELRNGLDDFLELRSLLAEGLRSLRLVPNIRLLEFALYFYQALRFAIVVKDTPLTPAGVR